MYIDIDVFHFWDNSTLVQRRSKSFLFFTKLPKVGSSAKNIMIKTLKNQFGRYRLITEAWNTTQKQLRCCGVDDHGWSIYENSWWDTFVNTDIYQQNAKLIGMC